MVMNTTQDSSQEIPKWCRGQLTPDDLTTVAAAIKKAELNTTAEIVPLVVRSSTASSHVPYILILIYLVILSFFGQVAGWQIMNTWVGPLLVLLGALAAVQLYRIDFVNRWLSDLSDSEAHLMRRAELEFYRAGLQKTNDRTGILLFVSLAEHRAVVLADTGISDVLPKETWQGVCDLMIKAAKGKKLGAGIASAILLCGELAARHFPAGARNPDEISNRLLIRE